MGDHFDESTVFPIIAEAIETLCNDAQHEWADRDLIVECLLAYDDEQAMMKAPSLHWNDRRLYENMVDWWSACFTSKDKEAIAPYLDRFQQGRVACPLPGNPSRTLLAYRPKR